MTNYEKLKTMSFFEMLEFLGSIDSCAVCSRRNCDSCDDIDPSDCKPHIKKWMDSEFVQKE